MGAVTLAAWNRVEDGSVVNFSYDLKVHFRMSEPIEIDPGDYELLNVTGTSYRWCHAYPRRVTEE